MEQMNSNKEYESKNLSQESERIRNDCIELKECYKKLMIIREQLKTFNPNSGLYAVKKAEAKKYINRYKELYENIKQYKNLIDLEENKNENLKPLNQIEKEDKIDVKKNNSIHSNKKEQNLSQNENNNSKKIDDDRYKIIMNKSRNAVEVYDSNRIFLTGDTYKVKKNKLNNLIELYTNDKVKKSKVDVNLLNILQYVDRGNWTNPIGLDYLNIVSGGNVEDIDLEDSLDRFKDRLDIVYIFDNKKNWFNFREKRMAKIAEGMGIASIKRISSKGKIESKSSGKEVKLLGKRRIKNKANTRKEKYKSTCLSEKIYKIRNKIADKMESLANRIRVDDNVQEKLNKTALDYDNQKDIRDSKTIEEDIIK